MLPNPHAALFCRSLKGDCVIGSVVIHKRRVLASFKPTRKHTGRRSEREAAGIDEGSYPKAVTLTLDARKQRLTCWLVAGNETLFLSVDKPDRIIEG